jgi:hypothetical protein
VFEPLPDNVRFAKNITHFLAFNWNDHKNIRNFGHVVYEGLASMYHAMESFDLLEAGGRVVHFQNLSISDFITGPWKCPRSGYFYLFPHTSTFMEEYPSGTCFHRMVVGHTAVASIWNRHFSVHRTAHLARFRRFYLHLLQLDNVVTRSQRREKVVVNFYPRHVRGWVSTWKDVCKLSVLLEEVFSDVEFRCISLHSMSIELQAIPRIHRNREACPHHETHSNLQAQAISSAAVHVWPNGKRECAYCPLVLWPTDAVLQAAPRTASYLRLTALQLCC